MVTELAVFFIVFTMKKVHPPKFLPPAMGLESRGSTQGSLAG